MRLIITIFFVFYYLIARSQVIDVIEGTDSVVFHADFSFYDSVFLRVQDIGDLSKYVDFNVNSDDFSAPKVYCSNRYTFWEYSNSLVEKESFDFYGYHISVNSIGRRSIRLETDVKCKVRFFSSYHPNPYLCYINWVQGTSHVVEPGEYVVFLPYIIQGQQVAHFEIDGCPNTYRIFYLH